jgi:hypothetical protein
MKKPGLLLLLLPLSGCVGLPTLDKVWYSYQREHPNTTVVRVEGQLTNRAYAQFHIFYTIAGDVREHEDVWYYDHAAEAWVPRKREAIR